MNSSSQKGFSLIELMVGLLLSTLVLAGAYSLWKTHQTEGFRLEKKIDLRNGMTLSSKKIQRAITLAGIGLQGSANLAKEDAVGSDTLILYTNPSEASSTLASSITHGAGAVMQVSTPSAFASAGYVVVRTGNSAEIRKIMFATGSSLYLNRSFTNDHPTATSVAFPAARTRFYTDQENNQLMWDAGQSASIVAKNVTNFQVSFRNKHGEATEIPADVRTVQYSFTGIFPAQEGALNSIVFSSTAIPRNTL
jgi:prepilin-type N-terminal cleavage/methylation domain-containing protein